MLEIPETPKGPETSGGSESSESPIAAASISQKSRLVSRSLGPPGSPGSPISIWSGSESGVTSPESRLFGSSSEDLSDSGSDSSEWELESRSGSEEGPEEKSPRHLSSSVVETGTQAHQPVFATLRTDAVIARILDVCAFLAPGGTIPVDWLKIGLAGPQGVVGAYTLGNFALEDVERGINMLQERDPHQSKEADFLSVLPEEQEKRRQQLSPEERKAQIKAVQKWLDHLNPDKGSHQVDKKKWHFFLPHLESIIYHHGCNGCLEDLTFSNLLCALGTFYLFCKGRNFKELARSNLSRALTIKEKLDAPRDRELAVTLKNLGIVYGKLKNLYTGNMCLLRALKIEEECCDDKDHLERLAAILTRLAINYHHLDERERSKESAKEVLQIFQRAYGILKRDAFSDVNLKKKYIFALRNYLTPEECGFASREFNLGAAAEGKSEEASSGEVLPEYPYSSNLKEPDRRQRGGSPAEAIDIAAISTQGLFNGSRSIQQEGLGRAVDGLLSVIIKNLPKSWRLKDGSHTAFAKSVVETLAGEGVAFRFQSQSAEFVPLVRAVNAYVEAHASVLSLLSVPAQRGFIEHTLSNLDVPEPAIHSHGEGAWCRLS